MSLSTSMLAPPSAAESLLLSPRCGADWVPLRRAYRVAGVVCAPVLPALVSGKVEGAGSRCWL